MFFFGNLILKNKKKASNFTKLATSEKEATTKVHLNKYLSYYCHTLWMLILGGLKQESNIILPSAMPWNITVWRICQMRSLTNLIRILVLKYCLSIGFINIVSFNDNHCSKIQRLHFKKMIPFFLLWYGHIYYSNQRKKKYLKSLLQHNRNQYILTLFCPWSPWKVSTEVT